MSRWLAGAACVGLLAVFPALYFRRAATRTWFLVVKLTFASPEAVARFEEIFAPLAAFVRSSERSTLAYELLKSDKDPLQVMVFERYTDREHAYMEVHRKSVPFLKFREELNQLNPKIDGHSYTDTGSGFMDRTLLF
jgi:quinol monooxygenase YgiN